MSSDRAVLHILPSAPWGGIQALVPMLAREQVTQGQRVSVLCLGRSDRLQALMTDYGLDVVTRRISGPLAPVRLLMILLRARGAIVHTHCEPIWAAAIIALSGTQRWVEHAHVYPDDELTWKKRVSRRLQRAFASRHIAISNSVGRALRATGIAQEHTLDIVHNGVTNAVDAPVPRIRTGKPFTVGFVGRVVAEKGIFDFLKLAAVFVADERFDFAVYGDGADLAVATDRAVALGIDHRIVFHGYVEDIAAAWNTLDLAAILSHREPFGLVFLEAVQRGVPTISYANDSGGSEVAAELQSAYRIAPEDLTAAAAVIRNLAENSRSPDALAQDRDTIAQRFDISAMARGVDAVYRRLDPAMATPSDAPGLTRA